MVGILYVAVAPAGDPDAFTLRALRLLQDAAIVLAEDIPHAQRLLAHHGLAAPVIGLENAEASLPTLETSDIVLLLDGWQASPSASSHALVRSAIERGFAVVPVPGPSLPITALVASGLPADTFAYLGELPTEVTAQQDLLTAVAGERRTLVAVASTTLLPAFMETLGQRPLVLATASDHGITMRRWSTVREAAVALHELPAEGPCVLVIGGLPRQATHWDEDYLRSEVQAQLGEGHSARRIGKELAAESGWPRRTIYRLAVELQTPTLSTTRGEQDEARSGARPTE